MASEVYRISWEMVSSQFLHLYCDADPRFYAHTRQTVPNSEIPEEHWHPVVSKETDSPWQQHTQLKTWADAGEQFVRNVKLERMVSTPEWEVVG